METQGDRRARKFTISYYNSPLATRSAAGDILTKLEEQRHEELRQNGGQLSMKRNQLILAIDDNKETLRMLTRILELGGYDVAIAADGISAVTTLEEHKPDLIILDIMMPEMDGFQILNLIRQRSNVPVIMLTAKCEVTTLHDALVLGADDYVRKPFRTRELLARIGAKLRRAEPETIRRL